MPVRAISSGKLGLILDPSHYHNENYDGVDRRFIQLEKGGFIQMDADDEDELNSF